MEERQMQGQELGPAPSLGPTPLPPRFEGAQLQPALSGLGQYSESQQALLAGIETRHGMYLAASGTLTQFNAIVAAIQGSALSSSDGALKLAIAAALLIHVLAAFVLCWAARPVKEGGDALSLTSSYKRTDDTFRNYRRGWRTTLLALTVSFGVLILFLLQSFGVNVVLRWPVA